MSVSRETAENGMKDTPKFIEIRDENKTGSILHQCAQGYDCNAIKAWMERQPENRQKSSTQKAIKDVLKNVGGGSVIVKNGGGKDAIV